MSNDPLQSGSVRPGDGNCQFLNLFGNSVTALPGSPSANTRDIIEYVTAQDWLHFLSETGVFDFVVSGPVFDLPAGPLGLAFGLQQRSEKWTADYPTLHNQGQSDLQAPFFDKDVSQTAQAAFAEISVPVFSNNAGRMEFSGAVRYEEGKESGLSTTDPKLGLLYSLPGGWLDARTTWSTSFLAPSLYQRFRQNVVFTNAVDDGATPGVNENLGRVPTTIAGNPDLKPQTSENFNFGVTVRPLDSLKFDIDYWRVEFEGQIAVENGLAVALAEGPLPEQQNPAKVIRNDAGALIGLNLTYINNATVETAGIDIGVSHLFDSDFGALRNSLQATYQTTYEVNGVDHRDSRNARVTGASYAVPWRATLRSDYSLGAHSAQSVLRFTDGYENDVPPNRGTPAKPRIESYLSWDLSYSYALSLDRFNLRSSSISIGLNNVTDAIPPWVPDQNHTLFTMYDYSGRHYWLRFKAQF